MTTPAGMDGSPRSPFRPPDAPAPLLLSRAHFSARSREGWQRAKNYYEALVNLSVFVGGCLFVSDGSVAILEHAPVHPWSCWFVLLVLPLLFGLVWFGLVWVSVAGWLLSGGYCGF